MKAVLGSVALVVVIGCSSISRAPAEFRDVEHASEVIYFSENSGAVEEHSLRDANIATHIYLDASSSPYFFFSFPAGNSGVAVWFKTREPHHRLTLTSRPRSWIGENSLRGAQFDLQSEAKELEIEDSVLGSMRFIRDRELKDVTDVKIPDAVHNQTIQLHGNHVTIHRSSLSGLVAYELDFETLDDTRVVVEGARIKFLSTTGVRLRVLGATSERPATPILAQELFKPEILARISAKNRDMISFLAYREKIMAGSPRYDSEFGRDSLFTIDALFEDLRPSAIEDLLMANISDIQPSTGEISHERSEGDFVSFERMERRLPYKGISSTSDEYKMVDENFAFAKLIVKFLLRFPDRSTALLARHDERGNSVAHLIQMNFDLVEKSTSAFVRAPGFENLVSFKAGETVGDWRDSEEGNARATRTFNVNAALVPGALKALSILYADPQSAFHDAARAARLARAFAVWNVEAPKLFRIHVSAQELHRHALTFYKSLGKNPAVLPEPPVNGIDFFALSITSQGFKNPIIHSDDGLMMMWGEPSLDYLQSVSQRIQLPFPYGLRTTVGIVIANPVLAEPAVQKRFGPEKYHGTVIWTMQEDLLQKGLDRQLARDDLSRALRTDLLRSRETIIDLRRHRPLAGAAEILMIKEQDGREVAVPFSGDAKGNSNQLWSHWLDAQPAP